MGASCFGPGEASYFVPQAAARDKEYLLSQPDMPQAACRASAKATASWMAHAFRLFYFLFFLFFPFFFLPFLPFFFIALESLMHILERRLFLPLIYQKQEHCKKCDDVLTLSHEQSSIIPL